MQTTRAFDAIIVGGGHNGLVAANYLARAGKRVAVLERRSLLGGAAVTEEITAGFRFSRASYVYSLFRPHIARDLALPSRGLRLLRRSPSSFSPAPEAGGQSLTLGGGDAFDEANIAQFSATDVAAWRAYNAELDRYCTFARYLMDVCPPDMARLMGDAAGSGAAAVPLADRAKELAAMLRIGARAGLDLGLHLPAFLSFLTSPASKVLDSYFTGDLLKATLATDAVIGSVTSPYTPQSAYVLLHHVMCGAWFNVEGGMGNVSNALAAAARAAGVHIETNAVASRILVDHAPNSSSSSASAAAVVGVETADGRQWRAPLVFSNAAPTLTLGANGLLREQAELLPATMRRALAGVDSSSGVVKINCALDALPNFRCRLPGQDANFSSLLAAHTSASAAASAMVPGEVAFSDAARGVPPHLRGTIHFESSMQQIDASYRDAAAGRASERPLVEMTLPSVLDASLAPPGKHVALLFCQYAPRSLDWSRPGARDEFADRVFAVIDEYAPGFSSSVLHREILAPPDLEAIFGLPGGNIAQHSIGLDQLFTARPVPGLASYRTPVRGLYLCGAGTHPGGGVMGAPGHNAVVQALGDAGWSRARLRSISSCPTL